MTGTNRLDRANATTDGSKVGIVAIKTEEKAPVRTP